MLSFKRMLCSFTVVIVTTTTAVLAADAGTDTNAVPGAKIASKDSYLAGVTAEMKKTWPHNRIINIVAHGHSVPAGYSVTPRVDTFNAYPHLLHVAEKSASQRRDQRHRNRERRGTVGTGRGALRARRARA